MDTGAALVEFERVVRGSVGLTTQALGRAAPGAELTFPQWRVLVILGDTDRGARVGEIASRVGVTVPATSRLLQRLRRRGLISLERDADDRRATRACLTDEGHAIRDAIFSFRRRALERALSSIASSELEVIAASLSLVASTLDAWL